MKSMMFCLAVGLTFATAALYSSCAKATELPADSICHIKADIAYDTQLQWLAYLDAAGEPTGGLPQADQAYGDVLEACEWDADFGEGVPLNELVAVDGEPVWPVCKFEGGCVK